MLVFVFNTHYRFLSFRFAFLLFFCFLFAPSCMDEELIDDENIADIITQEDINRYNEVLYFTHNKELKIEITGSPISILNSWDSSSSYDNALLNYFSIVQVQDGLFYMYYTCLGKNDVLSDFNQHLCFAYSNNGINWIKGFPDFIEPPFPGTNLLYPNNMIECQVFKVPDKDYPYRIIGNQNYDGVKTLVMLKSSDGIHFDDKSKKVLSSKNDSQVSCIVEGKLIKIYLRMRVTGRNLGVMYCDFDGNVIEPPKLFISFPFIYQASAANWDSNTDLLFPTLFDNSKGNDDFSIVCFIVEKGTISQSLLGFHRILLPNEYWAAVSPGIIRVDNSLYLTYSVRYSSHDSGEPLTSMKSEMKMVRVLVDDDR